MKIMNKDYLGTLVGTKLGKSKKDGISAIEAVFEAIREGLLSDGVVDITKEIKFTVAETAERKGRNPQSGEELTIPAGKKIKIKQLKNFDELV